MPCYWDEFISLSICALFKLSRHISTWAFCLRTWVKKMYKKIDPANSNCWISFYHSWDIIQRATQLRAFNTNIAFISLFVIYIVINCSFFFRFMSGYYTNLRTLKYQCSKCSYSAEYRSHVNRHSIVHLSIDERFRLKELKPTFKCRLCVFTTNIKGSWKKHLIDHKSLEQRQKKETHTAFFKCRLCTYNTKIKDNLKKHAVLHERPVTFKCEMCPYVTKYKSQFQRHSVVHKSFEDRHRLNELMPFSCQLCPFTTNRKCSLKKHSNIHKSLERQMKVYKCKSCPYTSKRKSHLRSHIASHDNITEFKCQLCPYTTMFKSHFKRHLLITHKTVGNLPEAQLPFKCPICPLATRNQEGLAEHLKVHSRPGLPQALTEVIPLFKCQLCSYDTDIEWYFTKHMTLHKT